MTIVNMFDYPNHLSSPPPGAVNVDRGRPVEGPGGRWVPCATQVSSKSYVPGIFQVGIGMKQVCATDASFTCPGEALTHAEALARFAAT